jgi:hypothetical protein
MTSRSCLLLGLALSALSLAGCATETDDGTDDTAGAQSATERPELASKARAAAIAQAITGTWKGAGSLWYGSREVKGLLTVAKKGDLWTVEVEVQDVAEKIVFTDVDLTSMAVRGTYLSVALNKFQDARDSEVDLSNRCAMFIHPTQEAKQLAIFCNHGAGSRLNYLDVDVPRLRGK